ncbi:universal stress protein [Oceanisphaera sp. IT1-181]|uniref:universal stress protein n=1 Tax=Oceanisphaera sp. IT1-181 TaxID=3081199 RepID=UPI0029CA470C|nr:universal stress protein [Oceanisphaera sp. IT1-181]
MIANSMGPNTQAANTMAGSKPPRPQATGTVRSQSCERPTLRHVLACVNGAPFAAAVLSHAAAVAKAVGARMTVIHVIESAADPAAQEPMDPVEWTLRHYDTVEYLDECMLHCGDLHTDAVIVAGRPAERISAWAHDHAADLIVLGRGGARDAPFVGLGDTARRVAEVANASVLLVPTLQADNTQARYRKVLVPLDGSSRSECVLPLGLDIAASHGGEVVLVHVAPKVELIESNLLNAQVIALRDQLHRHNEQAARQYLDWLRTRLPAPPTIGTRLLPSGDARRTLAHMASEEQADLVVLSAAGKSGHADIAVGSVADYLINRLDTPVLLMRQRKQNLVKTRSTSCHAMDMRLPGQGMV